jgi:hypothetical protein
MRHIGRFGRVVDDIPGSGDHSPRATFSDGNLHMDFTERMVIFDHRQSGMVGVIALGREQELPSSPRSSPRPSLG